MAIYPGIASLTLRRLFCAKLLECVRTLDADPQPRSSRTWSGPPAAFLVQLSPVAVDDTGYSHRYGHGLRRLTTVKDSMNQAANYT